MFAHGVQGCSVLLISTLDLRFLSDVVGSSFKLGIVMMNAVRTRIRQSRRIEDEIGAAEGTRSTRQREGYTHDVYLLLFCSSRPSCFPTSERIIMQLGYDEYTEADTRQRFLDSM